MDQDSIERIAMAWVVAMRPEVDRAKLLTDPSHAEVWVEAKRHAMAFVAMHDAATPLMDVPPEPPVEEPANNPPPSPKKGKRAADPAETDSAKPGDSGQEI